MRVHRFASSDTSTHRAARHRARTLAVGAAALGLVVASGASVATANDLAPPSYISSWLALNTGSTNTVSLVTPNVTTTPTQVLSGGSNCAMTTSGASLLGFTTSGSFGAGLNTGSIGVREKKNALGTSCAAVDAAYAESLTLSLKSGVGGLLGASASLDIDLKQSSQILAVATRNGSEVARYELRSGSSITAPAELPGGPVPAANLQQCNNPADSGPDSGINNNCRWEIGAPTWTGIKDDGTVFDALTLTAVTGSFSLEGGADGFVDDSDYPMPSYLGSDRDASIIELVQGAVTCGETVALRGTITSSWKRLANLGTEPCAPFPYSSRTGTDAVGPFAEFTKPLDIQTKAQALWTTTFAVSGGGSTPPIRVVLDVFNSSEKLVFDPLLACPDSYFDSSGAFVGPTSVPTSATACLVSAVKGTGKLSKTVTYTAYIYGDATMRR
jgi:hypothetical protein